MNHTSLDRKSGNSSRLLLSPLPYVLIFALCTLLSASFALAADKLVVKDGGGTNTVFRVDDTGTVEVPNGLKWDNSTKKFGIATTNPQSSLHVVDTVSSPARGLISAQHSNDTIGAIVVGRKTRGTESSPAPILPGDYLGAMNTQGYDGIGYQTPTSLASQVEGPVSPGSIPTSLVFNIGSATSNKPERMRITSTGKVGIGTSSPSQLLDVNSDGIRIRNSKTPLSSADTCNQGDMAWDSNYVYVCISSNLWKRASLGTW